MTYVHRNRLPEVVRWLTRRYMVAALHGWVQAYDNLSAMPDWLSNGLCRLVTGGGISTRGLFTNHEEVVWSAHRPVILTSIDDIVRRPDVIDRSIFIQRPDTRLEVGRFAIATFQFGQ
jgi:hypothetical protein